MSNFTNHELNTIEKSWKHYHKSEKNEKTLVKKVRVCIYLRKSTEDIKDNSLKLQLNEINKFIMQINKNYQKKFIFFYDEEDVYKEDNVSGMQGRLRPEFDKMLSQIENNPGFYSVCFVYKMDRFSRKLEDTLKYISLLKSFKCVLKALDFDDNGDPTSDLLKNILGVVAQYHAQNSALTSIKGTMKKVEEHKTVGLLPLGYISEKVKNGNYNQKGASNIVIDQEKAIIIKEIFEKYANGMSVKDIEMYLSKKCYTKHDGSLIKYQQIYYILRNKKYNGTYIYADPSKKRYYKYDNGVNKPEFYEKKNAFPKIIEDDLFNKVQDMIEFKKGEHQQTLDHSTYLLSGLIYCGECGSKLHGWSRPKYQGKIYYDYVCTIHKNQKELCKTKRINKLYIEKVVVKILIEILNNIILSSNTYLKTVIEMKTQKEREELELIKKQINFRKLKIDKLVDRLIFDQNNKSIYDEKIVQLEKEINILEQKLIDLNNMIELKITNLNNFLEKMLITDELLYNNISETKFLIKLIFKKIILTNKEIKIYF